MRKNLFICLFLLSFSANIIYSSVILENAYQAAKRGAIFGALASTPCLIMSDSSLMEKIATPFATATLGGIISFITQSIKECSFLTTQALHAYLHDNIYSLNPYLEKIAPLFFDKDGKYSSNQANYAQEWGRAMGVSAGLVICILSYTKTGPFARS